MKCEFIAISKNIYFIIKIFKYKRNEFAKFKMKRQNKKVNRREIYQQQEEDNEFDKSGLREYAFPTVLLIFLVSILASWFTF